MQNSDCRLQNADQIQNVDQVQNVDCRLGTKCRLRIWSVFFSLVCDNISSYNLPSVTQSLFRDKLSRLFALLYNIPGPFLDQNRSYYNFMSSYSLLTLRLSWFLWCLYRCYQLNKSRCRRKWDVTIEYLTRAILDKQLTTLHVVHHLFKRYVFILST